MRLVLFASFLVLAACPPPKPVIPDPEPTGRCDVDLATFGFADVGTGVTAKVIESSGDLIGGNYAQGRLGDFLLANDRLRVVIQQPSHVIAPIPYGGTIIDADLQRSSGPGRDEFGKLGLIYAFGRTVNVSKVEVLNDGSKGGYAVIAASGTDAVVDYVNVKNVITDFVGNVKLVRDPDTAIPFTITTYYVLSPGESRVRVLTAFCNGGKDTVSIPVGDLIEQGGVSEVFNPDGCTNGLGVHDCNVDPMSWLGYQADQVAYGYRTYSFTDPKQAAKNAVLYVAGVGAVVSGAENQQGLLTWFDENATRRPGSFGVLAGDKRTFLRDFFIGRDLAELSSSMLAVDAAAKSRLTVTVKKNDGTADANARVTVKVAETGRMATLLIADAQGVAKADLTPGNYLVGTSRGPGTGFDALQAVSVPSGGNAMLTLTQQLTHRLTVNVKDPFGAPLPAKVMVRCLNAPCATPLIAHRPFYDVESQPSDLQVMGFAGADGRVQFELPALDGAFEVLVTRGMEYSAFPDGFPVTGHHVDLASGDVTVDATIARVVDTTGWISADLHVHAMGSPDSAVGNSVRALSFAAEGVDVLVSTDHDFVTDYAPVIEQLQLGPVMGSMIGCEVTPFDFGHHNTFPLTRRDTPNGGAFDWAGGDGPTLRLPQMYAGIRAADPNAVIQMNHPRGSPGGALTMIKIDTATGATHADPATFRQDPAPDATGTDTKLFSNDFEAMEIMNGTSPNPAVINDWMTFMSRGWLKVGTGVSDTHYTWNVTGGYGRTWLKLGVDQPSQFTPAAFATAMRARKASFSSGPFITLTAQKLDSGGQPTGPVVEVGDTVSIASGGSIRLTVDVQAPEWMQFDSVEVHTFVAGREAVNGEGNSTLKPAQAALKKTYDPTMLPLEAVPGLNGFSARRVHVTETFDVTATSDTWFVAMARASSASRTLAPMAWDGVSCSNGVCTPSGSRGWGITNAILVDADGSGAYDDFPLKPSQPLMVAPAAVDPGPRRVPTMEEVNALLEKLLRRHH
ncbi:MAG: CehA/McbA family metallohydrolase [Myxococcaceae bacterium]